jgi:hypothetical protein
LTILLKNIILAPGVESFEDAVAMTVCYRLLLQSCGTGNSNNRGMSAVGINGGGGNTATFFGTHSFLGFVILSTIVTGFASKLQE